MAISPRLSASLMAAKTSGADQRLSWSLAQRRPTNHRTSSSGLFMRSQLFNRHAAPKLVLQEQCVGVRPHRVRTIIHGQNTRGGSRMPELGPYGSVRGALSIRPPKHAASDNHRRSTTRRSSLSSNETPGMSAKRRASAARRWHFSIKWLLCSTVTSASLFFACSTAAPVKRRPRGIGVGDPKQSPTCGALYAWHTHSH